MEQIQTEEMIPSVTSNHSMTISLSECHLFLGDTTDFIQQYDKLYTFLSAGEKQKAASFKFEKDRLLYVIAHGTLREIICSYFNCDPSSINFRIEDDGKPFITINDIPHQLQFSLSHSGTSFVFAFNLNEAIGADVETIVHGNDYSSVIQNYFSEDEKQQLENSSSRENLFYQLWTQKEAIGKVSGQGVSDIKNLRLPDSYQLSSNSNNNLCYSLCFPITKEIKTFRLSS